MNTKINSEIFELLKEKKFNFKLKEVYHNPINGHTQYEEIIPTITDVVMWIYEEHNIWILVDWMTRTKPFNSGFYAYLRGTTKLLNQDNFISINNTENPGYEVFTSPKEAYEAAIEYCLKELIK